MAADVAAWQSRAP
jgi:hypothetical protein